MATREAIVAAGRSWLDTPFVHEARLKGVGVDCAGVIIGVAREVGLSDYDISGYGRVPEPARMRGELDANMDRITLAEILPGDVLWCRIERDPQHLALITEIEPEVKILHSYQSVGRCVEHRLDEAWRRRIVAVFRFRGL